MWVASSKSPTALHKGPKAPIPVLCENISSEKENNVYTLVTQQLRVTAGAISHQVMPALQESMVAPGKATLRESEEGTAQVVDRPVRGPAQLFCLPALAR